MSEEKAVRVTPEEKLAIRAVHGRTDAEIVKDVEALKEWLKRQAHLPQELDDGLLQMMLQRNEYSLENAESTLDMYFSFRNLAPEFYTDRSVFSEQMQTYRKCMTFVQTPNLMKDLSRLFVVRFEDFDSTQFDLVHHMKFFFLMVDIRMYFDLSDCETLLLDFKHIKLDQVAQFSPPFLQKVCTIYIMGYPDRMKGMHFINLPSYANSIVSLVQSLFNDKQAARIRVHKNLESLYECIPKEDLPSDYHGHQKSVAEMSVDWKEYVESKNDWTLKHAEIKSNEALRTGGPLNEDIFGSMLNSFRNLNVD